MSTGSPDRLWKRAYEDLKHREKEVLENYTKAQRFENGTFQSAEHIHALIDRQLEERQLKQWVITLAGKPLRLREIGDKIIQFIAVSKEMVATTATLDPHAALAWSGISLLLPLVLNTNVQNEAMLGLDHVSHLVHLYKIKEDLYVGENSTISSRTNFENAVVDLYSHILEYQARLLRHLSRGSVKCLVINTTKHDDWNRWLNAIEVCDKKCSAFTVMIDKIAENLAWQNQTSQLERSARLQQQILEALQTTRNDCQSERNANRLERFLHCLSTDYLAHKNAIPRRVPDTCEWLLQDEKFHNWKATTGASLLWVSAAPGCGKSVLAKTLVEERRATNLITASTICYFFFRDGQQNQQNVANALKAILHQRFSGSADPEIMEFALSRHNIHGDKLGTMSEELWEDIDQDC